MTLALPPACAVLDIVYMRSDTSFTPSGAEESPHGMDVGRAAEEESD